MSAKENCGFIEYDMQDMYKTTVIAVRGAFAAVQAGGPDTVR